MLWFWQQWRLWLRGEIQHGRDKGCSALLNQAGLHGGQVAVVAVWYGSSRWADRGGGIGERL